jgi:hypothetical protein
LWIRVVTACAEFEPVLERLSQYGKLARKSLATPTIATPKRGDQAVCKNDEAKDVATKAA